MVPTSEADNRWSYQYHSNKCPQEAKSNCEQGDKASSPPNLNLPPSHIHRPLPTSRCRGGESDSRDVDPETCIVTLIFAVGVDLALDPLHGALVVVDVGRIRIAQAGSSIAVAGKLSYNVSQNFPVWGVTGLIRERLCSRELPRQLKGGITCPFVVTVIVLAIPARSYISVEIYTEIDKS